MLHIHPIGRIALKSLKMYAHPTSSINFLTSRRQSSDRLFPKLNLFTNKDKNEVYTVHHSVKSSQGKYIRKPKNPHVKAIKARGYTCAVRGYVHQRFK